jgi:hypothetical protein
MRREELAHLLRAAARIAADGDILVVGSQAILGSFAEDELPEVAWLSVEADLAFLHEDSGLEKATNLGHYDASADRNSNGIVSIGAGISDPATAASSPTTRSPATCHIGLRACRSSTRCRSTTTASTTQGRVHAPGCDVHEPARPLPERGKPKVPQQAETGFFRSCNDWNSPKRPHPRAIPH